jgi:hypothetical protein
MNQQRPPCIAFSVQLAAELTSAAAPRTVLQAAIPSAPPISNTVTSLRTIVAPPFWNRNDNESPKLLNVY